jgi:hypothetical protein
VLGVAPCGFGKGVIEADMVNSALSRGKWVLFIVRGRDRVFDMDKRVTDIGVPHGVLMGGEKRERWHQAQVASSDTVARMKNKPRADFILIDEAHLGCSPTFRSVLDSYPNAKILGFTATPMLGSGRALGVKSGGIFDAMVKGPSVRELISEGFLVRSRVFAPPPPEQLKGLKKKKTGEFDENQGAAICDTTKITGDIIENWGRHRDRKAIVFGFNQAHAFHMAEQFRMAGANWAYVDSDTPEGDIHTPGTRKFLWHQYDNGDLVGISSCRITEIGWDHGVCKHVIFGSKVGSFPTFHQRLGRAGRMYRGYSDFIVSDHCGNVEEHQDRGPFFESDIDWQLDGDPCKSTEKDSAQRVSQCKRPVKVPDTGVPEWFRGELSRDRKYMLCCYYTFAPGPDQCPRCGIPLETQERKIEVEAGELKELTPEDRERMELKIRQESERKAYYLDLVKEAKKKNYRDKYAPVVFKSKYGYWPPRGWNAEVARIVN